MWKASDGELRRRRRHVFTSGLTTTTRPSRPEDVEMARTSNSSSADDDEDDEDEDENNNDDDDDDVDKDDTSLPEEDSLRASVFLNCVVAKETTTRSVQITRKMSGNFLFLRRASGVVRNIASGIVSGRADILASGISAVWKGILASDIWNGTIRILAFEVL